VARLTHCGEEATDWKGTLHSKRLDEEDIVSEEEVIKAIVIVIN
jgi:hypothetical protein